MQRKLLCLLLIATSAGLRADSRELTAEEAAALEARVAARPDDADARAQLLRYYYLAPANQVAGLPVDVRRKHVVWLIGNQPEAGVLAELQGTINPKDDPQGYAEASAAWREQLEKSEPSRGVLIGAASFFQGTVKVALATVNRGVQAFPKEERLLRLKGAIYASAVAGVKRGSYRQLPEFDAALAKSDEAEMARRELLISQEPQVLTGALMSLPFLFREYAKNRGSAQELLLFGEKLASRLTELTGDSADASQWFSMLNLAGAGLQRDHKDKVPILEKALANAPNDRTKFYVLGDLAEAHLAAGREADAAAEATRLLAIAQSLPNDWNYGNAIHRGNLVLGRIALAKGNIEEAKKRLLAAGRTKGSPQLNSFGPQWELAQELLAKNEREVVLEYLSLCRAFWKGREADLDAWAAEIRTGVTPRLGRFRSSTASLAAAEPFGAGSPAPVFRLKDLHGKEQTLEAHKGKVVLLNFWTTWCGPCRVEMPIYEALHRELADKGVAVLAVNVDEPHETVAEFIAGAEEKYSLPVLLAKGSNVAGQYGINAFPTLVAVDRSGRVAEVVVGGRPESELRQVIERARAGAPPPLPAPQTAEDYLRAGIGLLHQRRTTEATAALTRALELRKDWPHARQTRAQAWYNLKRFEDSIADLNEVIRSKPDSSSAYNQRGLAYSYSGRHEQAISDYTKAIDLQPDMTSAYNNRGWAQMELGRHETALADLDRALDLDPAYHLALENRLRLYMTTKRYQEAIADAYSVLRMNPNSPWARERLTEIQRLLSGSPGIAGIPVLLSPPEGAVFDTYPRSTLLKWSEVTGASAYQVEIDYFFERALGIKLRWTTMALQNQ